MVKLRVVSGIVGGRKIVLPKRMEIRPTQERVRGAIFNSLAAEIVDSHFLDLYAGSGAVGIEALSWGAASATFVEHARACCDTIKANLETCGFEGSVVNSGVSTFLEGEPMRQFDIIFADPPYLKEVGSLDDHPIFGAVTPWLRPGGILIFEHYAGMSIEQPPGWIVIRDKEYGETGLTYLTQAKVT